MTRQRRAFLDQRCRSETKDSQLRPRDKSTAGKLAVECPRLRIPSVSLLPACRRRCAGSCDLLLRLQHSANSITAEQQRQQQQPARHHGDLHPSCSSERRMAAKTRSAWPCLTGIQPRHSAVLTILFSIFITILSQAALVSRIFSSHDSELPVVTSAALLPTEAELHLRCGHAASDLFPAIDVGLPPAAYMYLRLLHIVLLLVAVRFIPAFVLRVPLRLKVSGCTG